MNLDKIKYAYFLGIGGIGMSAIARYFVYKGITVAGYDKTPTPLTAELEAEGIAVHFDDEIGAIPDFVNTNAQETLLIYTPAIPKNHQGFNYLNNHGYTLYKRSEVLGIISRDAYCIAVAGTHGKTTTSTLIAHLLYSCNINFTAFLGGISANYNTNYIHKTDGKNLFTDKPIVVLEADEFDRSFHRLSPDIAVITAIDADHLDIYGTEDAFNEAFEIFASKIKPGGSLIANAHLERHWPDNLEVFTYCLNSELAPNFQSHFSQIQNGEFLFDYIGVHKINGEVSAWDLKNIYCGLPGFHNIENATAAIAVCLDILGLNEAELKQGLASFRGAKRRFEFIVKNPNYVVIDDYAHHPEELNAILTSVKELYPQKKLTAIFQPHLFTRTRDFADGFAESLSVPDEIILMDIYPARELPIEGITSAWLLEKIQAQNKLLLNEAEILAKVKAEKPELLLILGAGDIDKLVPQIKEVYNGF